MSAATLTQISATPYSIKFLYQYTGGGVGSGTASILASDIVAALTGINSPLAEYLSQVLGEIGGWVNAPKGPFISVYTTILEPEEPTSGLAAIFGNPSTLYVGSPDNVTPAVSEAIVEIRYHHTIDR